jgi:hypothetical protein
VIHTLFGGGTDPDIDRSPHDGACYDERVEALLGDPREVDRIVVDVLRIVDPPGTSGLVRSA